MKKVQNIYKDGDHSWDVVARDPDKPDYVIDTNEYLISNNGEAIITDPGGMEIFPAVFSAVTEAMNASNIKTIFASHQDPDIISSLSLWLEVNPEMKCYLSWLWGEFVPHFGGNKETFILMPDEGMEITVGNLMLNAIPAHFLHSAGNFHLYDEKAKILFSGDVGAALLAPENDDLFVTDFSSHIKSAEGFHKRWMGSNSFKRNWCERVSVMDIDMLCPQHGAIYRGDDVSRFINWFDGLEIGILK